MFTALNLDPAAGTRTCQAVDTGHVHGSRPCPSRATVHCRRNGEDVCERHETGHAARTRCGQGEHEAIPTLVHSA